MAVAIIVAVQHEDRAAREGYDPLTGKTMFTLTIDTQPYYGEEHIYVRTTLNGIRTVDEEFVLRTNGSHLPSFSPQG